MITLNEKVELYTALTNAFIMLIGIIGIFTIKKDKLWKQLFSFLAIDGFLGIIIHALSMSETIFNILWVILLIMFALTINTALCIFSNIKTKHITILSIILAIILIALFLLKLDYLSTFFIYSIIIVILCLYYVIRSDNKNKLLILLSFIIMICSTFAEFFNIKIPPFNQDGVSHIILSIGLIVLLITIKKEK